jgi:hypothetical protein
MFLSTHKRQARGFPLLAVFLCTQMRRRGETLWCCVSFHTDVTRGNHIHCPRAGPGVGPDHKKSGLARKGTEWPGSCDPRSALTRHVTHQTMTRGQSQHDKCTPAPHHLTSRPSNGTKTRTRGKGSLSMEATRCAAYFFFLFVFTNFPLLEQIRREWGGFNPSPLVSNVLPPSVLERETQGHRCSSPLHLTPDRGFSLPTPSV